MKNENEFLKEMENLKLPDVDVSSHQKSVKMAIMNAERSAALGIWLIAVPAYFLFCVFIYYYAHWHSSWFAAMFSTIVSLDANPYLDFLAPIVLFVLPIVCIIINALAITHVQYQNVGQARRYKEFSLTIKLKWWNILLILLSIAIISAFIAFALTENISIKN